MVNCHLDSISQTFKIINKMTRISQPAGHTRDRYFLFQPAKVTSLSKRHFCRDENEK